MSSPFSLVFSDMIAAVIKATLAEAKAEGPAGASRIFVEDHQQNSLYGIHQLTVRVDVPMHKESYRIVIAPASAPILIGSVPADEHFVRPITR